MSTREIKCATVESPYSSDNAIGIINNVKYAMIACEYLSKKGIAPYASHLINTTHVDKYTTYFDPYVMDDSKKYHIIGREMALELTNEIRKKMDAGYFFVDFGESNGMKIARDLLVKHNIPIIEVKLLDFPHWKSRLEKSGVV